MLPMQHIPPRPDSPVMKRNNAIKIPIEPPLMVPSGLAASDTIRR